MPIVWLFFEFFFVKLLLKGTFFAGTDSGFVGSESSRQSLHPKLQPAKIKLVNVSPSASAEVKKVPEPCNERPAPTHSFTSTSTQSDPR